MFAIISDLHSNVEALTAVLEDLARFPIERIVCLGDVVGYGPEPIPVLDLVREKVALCVRGNHDDALTTGGYGFNGPAREAIDWTRSQLRPGFFSGPLVRERWDWITRLPETHRQGPDLFVHGSPRDPTSEYVLKREIDWGFADKYQEIFQTFERLLFVGHSHLPCVITDEFLAHEASTIGNRYVHRGGRAIVNVGSVGQPRDGDPRACYALVDGESVEWRRVAYDVKSAARKFAKIPELAPGLAERILVGK